MAKLNAIIALLAGKKTRSHEAIGNIHHRVQKVDLTSGVNRTYRPKDEDGDHLPPENKEVQLTVDQANDEFRVALSELLDVAATQDWGNCTAMADVEANGTVIIEDAPVTYLLFLEKQLKDIYTYVSKLPVLDPAENWTFDDTKGCYTCSSETTRTKKVPRNHVKAEATKEHPAQVEIFHEDIIAGYWTTTKFSGAMKKVDKDAMIRRVRELQDAVKVAREKANSVEVTPKKVSEAIFGYIFK